MLGATATAFVLKLPVETIDTRFGGIPSGLPHLVVPRWHAAGSWTARPAFTVAMLGAIESLMSAVVSDRMSNEPSQSECGTDWPGSGEHHVANVRRAARHGAIARHCDEHSLRGAVTRCGNDSFADALMRAAVCGAAGQLHSNGRSGGHSDDRRLQHG